MARSTAKSDEHRWDLIQIIFYLCESDLAMYSLCYLWRNEFAFLRVSVVKFFFGGWSGEPLPNLGQREALGSRVAESFGPGGPCAGDGG